MKIFNYIIIGGGMTGSSAAMAIHNHDPNGTIAMFSKENYRPYNRPPLTKGLWDGKELADITRDMEKYDVHLFLDDPVSKIDREAKTITDRKGLSYQYDKLLIATGGLPIHLPDSPEGIIYYRSISDYEALNQLVQKKSDFCVIGGGFIGSEITAALNKQGKNVTMIFPETGVSGLRFPDDLALFLNAYYEEKGVTIFNGHLVDSIEKHGDGYLVKYKAVNSNDIEEIHFDGVIVGIGIRPDLDLAKEAELKVDNGIVVNEFLQTNDPDIYAAGDVAFFLNVPLGKRMRVEHEDNANKMGAVAGQNMAGEKQVYDHMPFFYSDLFDLGYEAVGETNKDYEIIEDWIDPFKKGTIFYLKDDRIRGLIFWNLWGKVDQGSDLIKEGNQYQPSELRGLFS